MTTDKPATGRCALVLLLTLGSVPLGWTAGFGAASLLRGRNVSDVGVAMYPRAGLAFTAGLVAYGVVGVVLVRAALTVFRCSRSKLRNVCWLLLGLGAIPLFFGLAFVYG